MITPVSNSSAIDGENSSTLGTDMPADPPSESMAGQADRSGLRLTPRAAEMTSQLWQEEYRDFNALRVYLSGKGCDGFLYGVQFDHRSQADLIFEEVTSGVVVACDPESFVFLEGSVIDYVDDERGRGYLVQNPRHDQYRGKFYKKKEWQQALQERKKSREVAGGQTTTAGEAVTSS